MKRLLVIEDDLDIQELLKTFLEEEGHQVDLGADGVEGLDLFSKRNYDLVLLDVMMPKIDGFAVLELIRKQSNVPVMMLTALDSERDQLRGFDLKVDDYVTKPFSMPVLVKKVAAVLRRTAAEETTETIHYQDLFLDLAGYKAYIDDTLIELTQREFELIRELLLHKGKVLTRRMLLNQLWEYDFYGDERVVDTHIKNLRKKLGADYIHTIRGVGYRID